MKFGHYDDSRREYVITTPETPWPWINYLGTREYFALLSHVGGGYSFYRDARLRRLTRYRYNDVPRDSVGKYLYIRESDGTVWSPTWKPVKTPLDKYECRHGLSYSVFHTEKNRLEAELLHFVPAADNCEIQRLRLTNNSEQAREIKLFSYVEFCLFDAQDDMLNFQRNFSCAEVEIVKSTIFHKTEYRERRNHYSFYTVNAEIEGFDTDRDHFLGTYNGADEPERVKEGRLSDSVASGWAPIAAHSIPVRLEPGESRSFIFQLGYVENPKDDKWEARNVIRKDQAWSLIEKYNTDAKADAALKELAEYWDGLLGVLSLDHPDPHLRRNVSMWNQYQCMVTFNMSRSASYFESGVGRGLGFRDSSQDLLGFVHMVPDRARERILDIAATQFEDGGAYHQYQPLTKKGNNEVGGGFNDDPLWLILGASAYIKETGDASILNEPCPFENGKEAILFDHVVASFQHVTNNLGPHGLPLIGRADWNDCLNLNCFSDEPGQSFQTTANREGKTAESIFIAGLFLYCGPDFLEMCQLQGREDLAKEARDALESMEKVVLEHGWDGEWFLRAYDFFGNKVGSKECEEGQIFIEPQGMCTMAGIGGAEYARKALEATRERLLCPYGITLVNPTFDRYHLELGEITSYPPGYKENGGVFCHNNPWVMIGETKLGRGGRAFDYYRRISPSYCEDRSEIHRVEPYVYCQMIAGKDAVRMGEGKNSWLTGTAAWNFVAITQYILGIRPEFDGLRIDPCIPEEWKEYTVTRRFRGTEYRITVKNPHCNSKGTVRLTVDGERIEGDVLKPIGTESVEVVAVIE